jgi:pilus assembly protein CpaC
MLNLAMPEAKIVATPMNGLVLLTGTVAAPSDVEEAQRLTQAFVGDGTQVISRLRTATPQQVMLKVTIAEVSRTLTRDIGVNLQGGNGDFAFAQGRDFVGDNGVATYTAPGTTAVSRVLNVLGVSVQGAVDLREQNGLVTVLAEPNLTALSGETASFLAGGEFPIPVAQALGQASIEFRQYGVGLAFSPVVLENGRISMRVRPEVSELSSAGAVELNGFTVPSLTTRRAETTVELGSGQSFVIAGLVAQHRQQLGRQDTLPGQSADHRGPVPLQRLPARRDRIGHRRHALPVQPVSATRSRCPRMASARPMTASGCCSVKSMGRVARRNGRPMPTVAPRACLGLDRRGWKRRSGRPQRASVTTPATASAADAARPGFDF